MLNDTILEVVQQYWRFENSHQPFRQPLGFSWELRDDGLYAWQVNKDTDGNVTEINYDGRNDMLSEVALIPPYYEGATMLVMFLFSILPPG